MSALLGKAMLMKAYLKLTLVKSKRNQLIAKQITSSSTQVLNYGHLMLVCVNWSVVGAKARSDPEK